VVIDMPYGKGLDDAIGASSKIASGLDVTEPQVFIPHDPTAHRRHALWPTATRAYHGLAGALIFPWRGMRSRAYPGQ